MKHSWKKVEAILPDGWWLLLMGAGGGGWNVAFGNSRVERGERVFPKVDKGKIFTILFEMFERVGGQGRKRAVAKCVGELWLGRQSLQNPASQSVVPGTDENADYQPHLRAIESETLGVGPASVVEPALR